MSRQFMFFLSFCMIWYTACTKVTNSDKCQDGFLDPGEECDTDELAYGSCQDLGYYRQTGNLLCLSDCTLDRSVCQERCGDGVLQELHEECDQQEFGGLTCDSLGLGGGNLACTSECLIDTSSCEIQPVCGDQQILAPVEQCEGDDLQEESCQTQGFSGGTLSCGDDCRFDTSACEVPAVCGDQVVTTPTEQCEGTDLQGQTCQTQGYAGGTLGCDGACRFNFSACDPIVSLCGNGVIDSGETCDGQNLGGVTCVGEGFAGGNISCTGNCNIDTSGCEPFPDTCGNGVWDGGEACDGTDLNGASCIGLGFSGGQLACAGDCMSFDTSPCVTYVCGDNIIQSENGEVCDGSDLAGQTCSSRGHYGGTLACSGDCSSFDETYCID